MSTTSDSASSSESTPISRAVTSATKRFLCSTARLKTALGFPARSCASWLGPDGDGELESERVQLVSRRDISRFRKALAELREIVREDGS